MLSVVLNTQGITKPDADNVTETANKLSYIEIGEEAVSDSWFAACNLPFYNYLST